MGLDWCLVNKPKDGHAEEARSLRQALNVLNDGSEFSERLKCIIRRRLSSVTVLPCEVVQAPKVKDRPDWQQKLAEILEEHKRREIAAGRGDNRWQKVTLEEFLKTNAEKYDCEACPAKSEISGLFCRPCEFRGKVIGYMDFLGCLADEAYEDKSPEQMLDYARRLEEKRQEIVAAIKLTPDSENDSYLLAAIRWLRRWGEKGFSLYAWS
jgi:hypothetical protein